MNIKTGDPKEGQDAPSSNEIQESPIQSEEIVSPRRADPLGELIKKYKNEPPPSLIIPGVKQGVLGFLFGPSKSGKTIYLENLMFSIAAGRDSFIGSPLRCDNRKCLFVSYEENSRSRCDRNMKQLSEFTEEEKSVIMENYIASNQYMPKFVLGEEEWDALEDTINQELLGWIL